MTNLKIFNERKFFKLTSYIENLTIREYISSRKNFSTGTSLRWFSYLIIICLFTFQIKHKN